MAASSISQVLEVVKNYYAENLNPALSNAGLNEIPADNFRVGEPLNINELYCCVLMPKRVQDQDRVEQIFLIHLQLPGEPNCIGYTSVLNDVSLGFNPGDLTMFNQVNYINSEAYPLNNSGTSESNCEISISVPLDTCG